MSILDGLVIANGFQCLEVWSFGRVCVYVRVCVEY